MCLFQKSTKAANGCSVTQFESKIVEFLWRWNCRQAGKEVVPEFFRQVASIYPLNSPPDFSDISFPIFQTWKNQRVSGMYMGGIISLYYYDYRNIGIFVCRLIFGVFFYRY